MKQNLKNFNFCDFNFKYEKPCVKRNELSICEHFNLTANDTILKPVCGYDNYLEQILGKENLIEFYENYPDIENKIISVIPYEYFDEFSGEKKLILFIISSNYELFEISLQDLALISLDISFKTLPKIFENNQKIYFYSANDVFIYFYKSTSSVTVSNFSNLECFCDYQDKTYFVVSENPYSIYYSEKTEIEDIDEMTSSYDSVTVSSKDGKILSLIKFKSNLYVIQQYAISKLAGSSNDYYFNSNCNVGSKIFKETIAKINDYIIFYTTSGLYLFDGNEVKQVFSDLTYRFAYSSKFKGLIFNNKYYLLTDMNICGEKKTIVAEFNITANKFCIYYLDNINDINLISSVDNYEFTILTKNENEFKLLNLNSEKYSSDNKFLKFNKICFDDNSLKSIAGIKINSIGEFDLKISTEKAQKSFHIEGDFSIANIGISGYCFEIEIYSKTYFEIRSIIFSVENIKEQI